MAPLGWLPLSGAAAISWVGIALAIIGCGMVWSRLMPPAWAWRVVALLLLTGGSMYAIRLVNTGWPLALVVSLAWLAARHNRQGTAGALLGICAATKVFLFLFLPYWAWRRNWRAVWGCLGGATLAYAAGLLVEGPAGYVRWQHLLGSVTWGWMGANATLQGMLTRTLTATPTPTPSPFLPLANVPSPLLTALWALGAMGLAAMFLRRFLTTVDTDAEWAAVLAAAILISPTAWCYYWPMAAGPLAARYARGGGRPAGSPP
jgi:alpha-1,2-mannosyltransferase